MLAELVPYPFPALVTRMFRELEGEGSIFGLAEQRFFLGDPELDFSVALHGRRIASPLGPAAGPHTQMAQNLVLAWLAGSRCLELKTVQILDRLEIPRPCIDMRTVGLNAEWSQELRLEQSLEEYVKAAMLVTMLRESSGLELAPGFEETHWDLSVGYDLAGISSDAVAAFVRGMQDATATVDRLRREIPVRWAALRDLDFPTRLSDSVTLSTFHGCPPDEIERIVEHLLGEHGLHCVVKLNPTLLGPRDARELLHDRLGFHDLRIPDRAFEQDTSWERAVEIVERLEGVARERGTRLGIKLTNTLIVENDAGFLPAEVPEVYLSGAPLHVLAMELVRRFRRRFGDRIPISFSAGIDAGNAADAVALGLAPVTACTDLLRQGGYGRLAGYYRDLGRRMRTLGATDLEHYSLLAFGRGETALEEVAPEPGLHARCREALAAGGNPRVAAGEALFAEWVGRVRVLNTDAYLDALLADPRYTRAHNDRPPRKIGSRLELFDCVTCDLCLPVCPNDANFTLAIPRGEVPVLSAAPDSDGWRWEEGEPLRLEERHQIANFADFCNDCGNCDVFCPEDGGPYVLKPRFFRRREDWEHHTGLDGFFLERSAEGDLVLGRFAGLPFRLEACRGVLSYSGEGFAVTLSLGAPRATLTGRAEGSVDLTYAYLMDLLRRAVLDSDRVNYLNVGTS